MKKGCVVENLPHSWEVFSVNGGMGWESEAKSNTHKTWSPASSGAPAIRWEGGKLRGSMSRPLIVAQ